MPWREAMNPVVMRRVALLAPRDAIRELLVNVADEGTVAFDEPGAETDRPGGLGPAASRMRRLHEGSTSEAVLAPNPPDLDRCEEAGRLDLIAGEAQLEARSAQALVRGSVVGLPGWMPDKDLPQLAERVGRTGGAVVPIDRPSGVQPPTLLAQSGAARDFAPLVETYSTVPYADVNPSLVAGLAYVVMFGMMFADAGHGALLLLAAVLVRMDRWPRLSRLRPVWLFIAGAGVASMVFGALYGEFFGPIGVPVLWLAPLEHPVELLVAGIAAGAVLLAGAYALGTLNRFREGGWRQAVYAPSGVAGATLFLGLAAVAGGIFLRATWMVVLGGFVAVAGLATTYAGLLAAAGGKAAGVLEAAIELFDIVLRLGSNLVSFARLAAFGLTHAALGAVVWQATTGLWGTGALGDLAAVAIFLVGNALAFALEGLVAAIQALRLEYYELFSRVFDTAGWPFRPWHIPIDTSEAP